MGETIRIATANTFYGQLIREPDGLMPFTEAKIDALLLQEVHVLNEQELSDRLAASDYSLIHSDLGAGLGIALHKDAALKADSTRNKSYQLQQMGPLARAAMRHELPGAARLRPRGLIASTLRTNEGHDLAVCTAHPVVFAKPISRRRQLISTVRSLKNDETTQGPLIFAADLNHYPSPRSIDGLLSQELGLEHAELSEPTWRIRGSKREWLARLGSLVTTRSVDDFDAQLDSMWYRGVELQSVEVIDIKSDHRAIIGQFTLGS